MPSFLITGNIPDQCFSEAINLRKKISSSPLNPHQDPDTFILQPEKQTIGIDQIRRLKKLIPQKPPVGSQRCAIIHQSDCLTIPAQNALLKLLEEPPSHTTIILTAPSEHLLLPTIQSRCQIINISSSAALTQSQLQEQLKLFYQITDSGISQRITLAPKFATDRSTAIHFCRNQLYSLHYQLTSQPTPLLSRLVKNITYTVEVLNSNTNYLLALDNLLLKYPTRKELSSL